MRFTVASRRSALNFPMGDKAKRALQFQVEMLIGINGMRKKSGGAAFCQDLATGVRPELAGAPVERWASTASCAALARTSSLTPHSLAAEGLC